MRRYGVCLSSVSVLALLALGCGDRSQTGTETTQAEPNPQSRPIPVAIQILSTGPAQSSVKAWGTVHPIREAVVQAALAGRVSSVAVSLGDAVRRGQILLEIDPELYLARSREAEANLESARLAAETAAKDQERSEALFARGTISDAEIEAVRTKTAGAVAGHAAAEAALAQARKSLAEARLRAPFAGHVASRPPDPGSTVTLGMPLITLVAIDRVRVDALLSEQDLPRVRVGDSAALTVEGAPGNRFTGTVVALGPQADAETRQFPVEIEAKNPEGHPLKGGMVAKVEIEYENYPSLPLIPVDAVVESEDGSGFFVVQNGFAERRRLVAGPRMGQTIAVLDGAAAGDSVVVLGQERLQSGTAVRVEEVQ